MDVFLNGNLLRVAQVAVGLVFLEQTVGITAETVVSQTGFRNILDAF